jgi:hypothetical protein
MKTQDLIRFANRPWQVIGEADAAHWLAQNGSLDRPKASAWPPISAPW